MKEGGRNFEDCFWEEVGENKGGGGDHSVWKKKRKKRDFLGVGLFIGLGLVGIDCWKVEGIEEEEVWLI